MSAKHLLPGFGGAYTSETLDHTSTTGADTIDCSLCDRIAIQVNSTGSPTGSVDIEQTFDGTDWTKLVSNLSVADGTSTLLDETDAPFGLLRINATSTIVAGTSETVLITITGWGINRV